MATSRDACVVRALRQLYVSHAQQPDVHKDMPAVRRGIGSLSVCQSVSQSVSRSVGRSVGQGGAGGRAGWVEETIAGDCDCRWEFAIGEPRARAVPASEVGGVRHRDLRAVSYTYVISICRACTLGGRRGVGTRCVGHRDEMRCDELVGNPRPVLCGIMRSKCMTRSSGGLWACGRIDRLRRRQLDEAGVGSAGMRVAGMHCGMRMTSGS